jgi:hypothetical protein
MIWALSYRAPAVCLSLMIISLNAMAQDAPSPGAAAPSTATNDTCSLCSLLDSPRDFLSDNFIKISDRLDLFFSNNVAYEKLDKSFAELSINAVAEGDSLPNYYGDTRVFLELPRTQKRLNLMFQSESNGELDVDNPDVTPSSPDQQTTALVLRGDFRKTRNWRIYADIGSENRGFIDPFIRFTYYQNFTGKKKKWNWTWKEAIFRFGYRGNGITSGLQFNRPVSDRYHFRFSNQLIWYQTDDFYDRAHSLNFYQNLGRRNALAYSLGLYTTSDPADSVYYLQFRYKKLIHKTWLYYEVIPEVLYKASDFYSPTPRLTLKLEIMLGNA